MENENFKQLVDKVIKIHPNFIRKRLEELDEDFLEGILYNDNTKILPYVSSYENFIEGLELTDERLQDLIKIIFDSGKTGLDYEVLCDFPADNILNIYKQLDKLEVIPPSYEESKKMYKLFCLRLKEVTEQKGVVHFDMIDSSDCIECCEIVSKELFENNRKFNFIYFYYKGRKQFPDFEKELFYVVEKDHIKYLENDKVAEEYKNGAVIHRGFGFISFLDSVSELFFEMYNNPKALEELYDTNKI
ncbi:MAG: hypothetical protein E6686_03900 [Lachnospiraceae bacterium]|nr:hypothetical protein [Lachnospiraceae bacterium]